MRPSSLIGTTLLCGAMAACSSLPVSGPYPDLITLGASAIAVRNLDTVAYRYALVDLDANVVSHITDIDGGSFFASFGRGKGPAPAILVGRGDLLQITIFESKSGGLFIPADFWDETWQLCGIAAHERGT